MKNDDDQMIDAQFRNGTVTVVGVVLSFSLGFLSQWATNPVPLELSDLPALLLMAAGIVMQGLALMALLNLSSLRKDVYVRAVGKIRTGVILTAAGIFVAVIIDLIHL